MNNEKDSFNHIGISNELDMPRIRHLMKIGLFAGVMVLIGDMLLGYGASDTAVSNIPATFARYLSVSDGRIFWSAVLGLIGIPLECLCYFAVYRLIAQGSEAYAHTYRTGIFGCLIFGACGVHVPCCAAVFFLKKVLSLNPGMGVFRPVWSAGCCGMQNSQSAADKRPGSGMDQYWEHLDVWRAAFPDKGLAAEKRRNGESAEKARSVRLRKQERQ